MALDCFEAGALQILLQLLRGRANRNMIRPLREREAAMGLEDGPAAVTAKVHIIDVEFAAGTQNAERFLDIGIAVPAFEVHENHRAINKIDRSIGHGAEIVPREFEEFDIREIAQPLGRVGEHVGGNVGPDPALAASREAVTDPADAAADFQDHISRTDPDILEQKIARADAAGLDNGVVLGPADVQFRTRKSL